MTIDAAHVNQLLFQIEMITMEVPALYRTARSSPDMSLLATEQAVLRLFRRAAHICAEACAIASSDPATLAKLEQVQKILVNRLTESAYLCMALEDAALLAEAEGQTLH